MLQAMRNNTKIVLWITIFFFLLLIFLVWGADLQFGNGAGPQAGTLGSVNGDPVTVAAYQSVLQQNRQYARSQGRELQPSDYLLIEEDSWNAIVEEMLMLQEADRRGLQASDSEVRTVLLNNPPPIVQQNPSFQNEQGQFDINRYRQVLLDPATPESFLLQLEAYVRATLPLTKLQQLVISGAKVTEDEVRRSYLDQNERAKISYVMVEPAAGSDPQVTDAEVGAHFEATRAKYDLPRRADVRYVSIPRIATPEDSLAIRQELTEFADEAREAATTEGAENVRYSDFETLAMTFSDGPNADNGGLSSGYLTAPEMTPGFREALAGLAPGDISQPFQDGTFYHIIQLVDVQSDSVEAYQIRDLARRIVPSDSTITAVREQLDLVRVEAESNGLETAAATAGLPVSLANNVSASGFVPGLAAIPRVASFALQNPAGTVSRVYGTNSAWFVLEIIEVRDEGPASLVDVKSAVRQDLVQQKRIDSAREVADQLVGRTKLGTSLEDAAAEIDLSLSTSPEFTRVVGVPGLGQEPDVMVQAFAGAPGSVYGPVKGQRGWIVFQVEETPPMDDTDYTAQAPRIRSSLLSGKQSILFNAWLEEMRESAKIEDYRS